MPNNRLFAIVGAVVMAAGVPVQAADQSPPPPATSAAAHPAELQRLAKMLENPVANLISVPIQSNLPGFAGATPELLLVRTY